MKIVLRDDVENLGHKGDVVDVADGYARNYLVPRGLAMKATKGVVAQAEAMRRNRAGEGGRATSRPRRPRPRSSRARASRSRPAPARAASSSARSPPPTSPTPSRPSVGVEVDRRRVGLDEPVKELSEVEVAVKLHTDVEATVTVVGRRRLGKPLRSSSASGVGRARRRSRHTHMGSSGMVPSRHLTVLSTRLWTARGSVHMLAGGSPRVSPPSGENFGRSSPSTAQARGRKTFRASTG